VTRIVTDWFQIGFCECVYVGRVSSRAGLELVAFCPGVRLAASPARTELTLLSRDYIIRRRIMEGIERTESGHILVMSCHVGV
jgi:hypothetical protein